MNEKGSREGPQIRYYSKNLGGVSTTRAQEPSYKNELSRSIPDSIGTWPKHRDELRHSGWPSKKQTSKRHGETGKSISRSPSDSVEPTVIIRSGCGEHGALLRLQGLEAPPK